MPPKEQAKVWAVREVLKQMGEKADQYQRMSQFVVTADGGHPDRKAGGKFLARIDKDSAGWYPGKRSDKVGRPREMSEARMSTLCRRVVIATIDQAASNLDFFQQHHWLSDPGNVIMCESSGEG